MPQVQCPHAPAPTRLQQVVPGIARAENPADELVLRSSEESVRARQERRNAFAVATPAVFPELFGYPYSGTAGRVGRHGAAPH